MQMKSRSRLLRAPPRKAEQAETEQGERRRLRDGERRELAPGRTILAFLHPVEAVLQTIDRQRVDTGGQERAARL